MKIASALQRISEISAELESSCAKKASAGSVQQACRRLGQEFWAILTEVEAAQKESERPPEPWYTTAMLFLREALAIRYDQDYYRDDTCTDLKITHACWLEFGQLYASGRLDSLSPTVEENGRSVGKALGPAAQKIRASACSHVFEDAPPRTPARLLIEDGRAVPHVRQGAEIVNLTMFRASK